MSAQQYLINGDSHAVLSPIDRGLAYGDGVFRTMCVRQGRAEQWPLHYAKLAEDCEALGIACPDVEVLLEDLDRLFGPDELAVAKIIVTRGAGERGYGASTSAPSTRAVIKSPFPRYPEENFHEGIALYLCRLRLSRQPQLAGIKHLNRLENVLARMEWTDTAFAEGLLLDDEGRAIECVAGNIFARFDKMLLTPDLSQCGVAGVTRQRILEGAPRLGYEPGIAQLSLARLLQADELIVCNSLYGAWQVRSLDGRHWPLQKLAPALRTLLQD